MRSRKSPDSGAGMTSPPTHQNRPPRISIPDSAQHKSALVYVHIGLRPCACLEAVLFSGSWATSLIGQPEVPLPDRGAYLFSFIGLSQSNAGASLDWAPRLKPHGLVAPSNVPRIPMLASSAARASASGQHHRPVNEILDHSERAMVALLAGNFVQALQQGFAFVFDLVEV